MSALHASVGESVDEAPRASAPPPEPSTVAVPKPLPPLWVRRVVISVAVALFASGFVATAATPALAPHHPVWLIALEAPIRNLMLARKVPLLPFVLVGVSRRVLGASVMYLLGRWYGDAALRWFERHAGPSVRRAERFARSFGVPWVFLWPGPIVCVCTGAVGLPRVQFLASATSGALFLVLGCRYAGNFFAAPLDAVVAFFTRHTAATTTIAVGSALIGALRTYQQVRAKNREAQAELDAAAAEPRPQATRSPSASSAKDTAASSEPQSR